MSSRLRIVLGGAEQGPDLAKTHPFPITISGPEARTRATVGIPGLWAVQRGGVWTHRFSGFSASQRPSLLHADASLQGQAREASARCGGAVSELRLRGRCG